VQRYPEYSRRHLRLVLGQDAEGIARVREKGDACYRRESLLEQCEFLAIDFRARCRGQAGDVPARAAQARHESSPHRVSHIDHYDRDALGRLLGRQSRRFASSGDYDIDLELHELPSERR
jgi:hypothetical protein